MSKINATPTKLRNGNWGARVASQDVQDGVIITITTRSGKSWLARVERVVWAGNGVAICATQSLDRPASSTPRGGTCDECDRPSRRLVQCYDSSGIGGQCCPRCAAAPAVERSFA